MKLAAVGQRDFPMWATWPWHLRRERLPHKEDRGHVEGCGGWGWQWRPLLSWCGATGKDKSWQLAWYLWDAPGARLKDLSNVRSEERGLATCPSRTSAATPSVPCGSSDTDGNSYQRHEVRGALSAWLLQSQPSPFAIGKHYSLGLWRHKYKSFRDLQQDAKHFKSNVMSCESGISFQTPHPLKKVYKGKFPLQEYPRLSKAW